MLNQQTIDESGINRGFSFRDNQLRNSMFGEIRNIDYAIPNIGRIREVIRRIMRRTNYKFPNLYSCPEDRKKFNESIGRRNRIQ